MATDTGSGGGMMAIFAHPDDESFGLGGTMARYRSQGRPVTMVCATRGEVGEIAPGSAATPETLGAVREQELRDAMRVLDVEDVQFLDYRDSGMAGTPENADPRCLARADADAVVRSLVALVRDRKPEVMVTWDESGGYGHPDHVAVHYHATAAYRAAADGGRYPEAGPPWRTKALFYNVIPVNDWMELGRELQKRGITLDAPGGNEAMAALRRVDPTYCVEVPDLVDRKRQALLAHASQITKDDPFMSMPEDLARKFFAREWFYRADPPAGEGIEHDLFAGL